LKIKCIITNGVHLMGGWGLRLVLFAAIQGATGSPAAVDLFQQAEQQSEEQLTTLLQNFLKKSFGTNQDFSMDDPKPQSDGSVLIVWSYTDKSQGVDVDMTGNSFVEQHGDKVSILTTLVPHEQFDKLLESTNSIIRSYKIDDSSALP